MKRQRSKPTNPASVDRVTTGRLLREGRESLLPAHWRQQKRMTAIPPGASKIIRHYAATRLAYVQEVLKLLPKKQRTAKDDSVRQYYANIVKYYRTLEHFLIGIVGGKINQLNTRTHNVALETLAQLDGE